MYGTVARMRVKPGLAAPLEALSRRLAEAETGIPGYIAQYVYRLDADPDELYLTVLFESREAYHANAASPAQAARYEALVALLAAPPEWHDGKVIFAHPPRQTPAASASYRQADVRDSGKRSRLCRMRVAKAGDPHSSAILNARQPN